jgi:hypothetical protein
MAYRLPSERVAIDLDDLTVEVERVAVWAIAAQAVRLLAPVMGEKRTLADLGALFGFFIAEGQPTWAIIDHRGPIPYTVEGCYRLPLDTISALIVAWAGTITPPETAVDKLVPPSELRDKLNAKLRAKRAKAA